MAVRVQDFHLNRYLHVFHTKVVALGIFVKIFQRIHFIILGPLQIVLVILFFNIIIVFLFIRFCVTWLIIQSSLCFHVFNRLHSFLNTVRITGVHNTLSLLRFMHLSPQLVVHSLFIAVLEALKLLVVNIMPEAAEAQQVLAFFIVFEYFQSAVTVSHGEVQCLVMRGNSCVISWVCIMICSEHIVMTE